LHEMVEKQGQKPNYRADCWVTAPWRHVRSAYYKLMLSCASVLAAFTWGSKEIFHVLRCFYECPELVWKTLHWEVCATSLETGSVPS
jgi:high-affinity nickel permease